MNVRAEFICGEAAIQDQQLICVGALYQEIKKFSCLFIGEVKFPENKTLVYSSAEPMF